MATRSLSRAFTSVGPIERMVGSALPDDQSQVNLLPEAFLQGIVRRPLLSASVAFLAGAVAESVLPEDVSAVRWCLPAACLCLAAATLYYYRNQRYSISRYYPIVIAGIFFPTGLWVTRSRLTPQPNFTPRRLTGAVVGSVEPAAGGYRLVIQLEKAPLRSVIYCTSSRLPVISEGQYVSVTPKSVRQTDHRYRLKGIVWIASCSEDSITFGLEKQTRSVSHLLSRVKTLAFKRWEGSFPTAERRFVKTCLSSLVFGLGPGLTEGEKRALSRSGLAHLFVPSGSQISLLMAVAWLTARQFGFSPWYFLTLLTAFYLTLAQREPSIFRAVLMGLYAFTGWQFFRDQDWHTSLWLSAATMVAWDPSVIYDVGFQLSFAATFGIIYAGPSLISVLRWLPDWIAYPLATTFCAQLFVSPILLYYFGRVSLVAPVTNLLCAFPAALALSIGLFSCFVSLISPYLASPFTYVAGYCAKGVVLAAYWFDKFDYSAVELGPISSVHSILMSAFVIAVFSYLRLPEMTAKK